MLDPLAQARQLDELGRLCARQCHERKAERDLERCRGGHPRTPRQIAGDLDSGRRQLIPDALELGDRSAHKRAPARGGADLTQVELVALADI